MEGEFSPGAVVALWSLTLEATGLNPFNENFLSLKTFRVN